jgi:hypothetical protein
MRPLRLAGLALIAVFAAVAVAEAALYEVPDVLRDDVRRVAPKTDVPIRLPATLSLDFDESVFGEGSGRKDSYDFSIGAIDDCGNATACFLAGFTAEKGGSYAFRRRVTLARGIVGRYKPLTCGASCSPPTIEWKQSGHLYRLQAKLSVSGRTKQRRAMIRAANSAIRSTPR